MPWTVNCGHPTQVPLFFHSAVSVLFKALAFSPLSWIQFSKRGGGGGEFRPTGASQHPSLRSVPPPPVPPTPRPHRRGPHGVLPGVPPDRPLQVRQRLPPAPPGRPRTPLRGFFLGGGEGCSPVPCTLPGTTAGYPAPWSSPRPPPAFSFTSGRKSGVGPRVPCMILSLPKRGTGFGGGIWATICVQEKSVDRAHPRRDRGPTAPPVVGILPPPPPSPPPPSPLARIPLRQTLGSRDPPHSLGEEGGRLAAFRRGVGNLHRAKMCKDVQISRFGSSIKALYVCK